MTGQGLETPLPRTQYSLMPRARKGPAIALAKCAGCDKNMTGDILNWFTLAPASAALRINVWHCARLEVMLAVAQSCPTAYLRGRTVSVSDKAGLQMMNLQQEPLQVVCMKYLVSETEVRGDCCERLMLQVSKQMGDVPPVNSIQKTNA